MPNKRKPAKWCEFEGLYEENHTFIRAFERYRIELSAHDYADMVQQIQTNHALHLGSLGSRATLFAVYWPTVKQIVPVIYNNKTKAVATILPVKNFIKRNDKIKPFVTRVFDYIRAMGIVFLEYEKAQKTIASDSREQAENVDSAP